MPNFFTYYFAYNIVLFIFLPYLCAVAQGVRVIEHHASHTLDDFFNRANYCLVEVILSVLFFDVFEDELRS